MESPIRRLADQKLLVCGEKLPKRFATEIVLSSENPVELLLTHSPAVITAVDGKPCQYWLPAAYGVTTSGTVMEGGRINVMVQNAKQTAELLIALPAAAGGRPVVQHRKWSDTHDAGVAIGYELIKHDVVQFDGQRFVKLSVGQGQTEIGLSQ